MKKILNALFLTIITLVTFSCSDVPSPYDITEGGGGEGPALTGDGTKENPYDIASAMVKQDGEEAWVKGYIVGSIKDKDIKTESEFAPPFTNAANILIAASANESDYKKCIPVQLVGGTDIRTALNLKDNEGNLGKAVIIKGQLIKYFGVAGLKTPTAAVLDGKDVGEGGTDPEPPVGTVLFEETFAASQGAFTINNVKLPEGSAFVWQWSAYNESGYMKASAYVNNQNKAAESWLVSPSIDLTRSAEATLVFEHAYKFAADKSKDLTLWITEAGKNAWVQLEIPNYSDGASWTFVSSGNISLKDYVGKNIQFAFKYMSTTEAAGMWEVKNVKVLGDGDAPIPPVEDAKIFTETFGAVVSANTNVADYTGWDNANFAFTVTDPKINIRAIAHKTEANKAETVKVNHIWFPAKLEGAFTIANINAVGHKKFVLNYEVAANTYDAGSTIDLNVLKVAFDNTDLVVPSKVVTAVNKGEDANIFYEMQIEFDVVGTASSTLKFSSESTTNTLGLRLYNVRLASQEQGGTDPTPTPGSDLLISEYVEGSGFEKYIEIYNPSNQAVDLSAYTLKLEQDGKGTWTKEFNLTGSIASHGVIVYKNSQAVKYTGEAIVNNDVINFNGNDPVGLFKNDVLIDLFGVSSGTPGTAVTDFAKDKTFKRKSTVKGPSATYKTEEWDELGKDDVSGLGSHTMN